MIIVIPGAYNAQTGVVGGNVQGQTVTIGAILKVTQRDRRPFPTDSGSPSEIWIDNTSAIGYICKENGPTGTVWDRLDLLGDYIAFGDSDPGPNSDITWGFRPGSLRYARNSEILWICKDNTQGAAVWDVLSSGGSVVSVNGQTGVVQLYLDDLLDVDAPLPNNGDVLTWDSVTSTWVALAPTGGGGTYTVDNGLSPQTTPSSNPNNFQLGGATLGSGDLIRDTYITNNGYLFRIDQTGPSTSALYLRHSGTTPNNGTGLTTVTGGVGVRSSSSESYAFEGISSIEYTQQLIRNATSNNDVVGLLRLDRATSGVPFGGIGASIDFWVEARLTLVPPVLAPTDPTIRLAGIWEVPGAAVLARLSRFDMYGYSNGGTLLNASVRGDGKFVLHQYGQTPANFPGTPVWSLGVDASGNVVEFTGGGGGTYTVDNGLSPDPLDANNFQLGGILLQDTTIDAGLFNLLVTGVNTPGSVLSIINTNTGYAGYFEALSGGTAIAATSSGKPTIISGGVGVTPLIAFNNILGATDEPVAVFSRRIPSGSVLVGTGAYVDISLPRNSTGILHPGSRIITRHTSVGVTFDSTLELWSQTANSLTRKAQFLPTGQLSLDNYTGAIFDASPTKSLGVDASGNVITFTASPVSGDSISPFLLMGG